jgi:type IV secretory pathway protease TraF
VIKRVAGTPGDVVEPRTGAAPQRRRVLDPIPSATATAATSARRLGGDEYFLLGDHRRVSIDSREFGPVARAPSSAASCCGCRRVRRAPAGAAARRR